MNGARVQSCAGLMSRLKHVVANWIVNRRRNRTAGNNNRGDDSEVWAMLQESMRAIDRIDDKGARPREARMIVCRFLGEPAIVSPRRKQRGLQKFVDFDVGIGDRVAVCFLPNLVIAAEIFTRNGA